MPPAASSGSSFVGIGNLQGGAAVACGLRAFTGATANDTNGVRVRRGSDDAEQDIAFINGDLDQSTADAFRGTGTTGLGTISNFNLTFVGGAIGAQVSGAGIDPRTYIVNGSSPNWVTNASNGTIASESMTVHGTLFLKTCYDKSGNSRDQSQATKANQPVMLLNALNSGTRPAAAFNASQFLTGAMPTTSQPFAWVTVSERDTPSGDAVMVGSLVTSNPALIYTAANNAMYLYAGSVSATPTISDGSLHGIVGLFNGGSSILAIDGTETTLNPGASGTSTSMSIGAEDSGAAGYKGLGGEWVFYPATIGSTNRGAMHTNISAYWGTP